MVMMLKQVAETLQVSPEELWRQSLDAYIQREKRLAQLDVTDVQDRYRVSSTAELRQKIRDGIIYSHPAWEDLIEWENLQAYIQRLDSLCPRVVPS
ncbi:MAG: hypothetical protein FJ011_27730 [Chloroflexi bacterium]|nr:hypothetical protein [Chloroflexota bacterium]